MYKIYTILTVLWEKESRGDKQRKKGSVLLSFLTMEEK
jgi:hypothetical protein